MAHLANPSSSLQLEELDEIFEAKNPVKASTAKKSVAVDSHGGIVNIEKA